MAAPMPRHTWRSFLIVPRRQTGNADFEYPSEKRVPVFRFLDLGQVPATTLRNLITARESPIGNGLSPP